MLWDASQAYGTLIGPSFPPETYDTGARRPLANIIYSEQPLRSSNKEFFDCCWRNWFYLSCMYGSGVRGWNELSRRISSDLQWVSRHMPSMLSRWSGILNVVAALSRYIWQVCPHFRPRPEEVR